MDREDAERLLEHVERLSRKVDELQAEIDRLQARADFASGNDAEDDAGRAAGEDLPTRRNFLMSGAGLAVAALVGASTLLDVPGDRENAAPAAEVVGRATRAV